MKRVFLSLVLLAFGLGAMAQQIQLRSADKAECVKSDMTGLRANFAFSSLDAEKIETTRGELSEIHIDGAYHNGNVGEPQLPMFTRLIAIPIGATPIVTIGAHSETEYTLSDYGIGTVAAMQAPIRKDVDLGTVAYAFNEAAYARNSYNDDPIAMVEVLGTMRGITLGRLIVQPVRYNPAAGTVKVFNDIEVDIDFQNGDAESTAQMFKNTFSPAFTSVYNQIFNIGMLTGGTRDAYTDHPDFYNTPVKMLVICYSGFQGNAALESWLQWKLQKGYYVDIYYTSETGSTASAIASFIKTKYNASVSAGNAYTYLVVIGDTGQVPQYMTKNIDSSIGNCASDLGYASVNFSSSTSNYFPDMYYSRISVENTTHLTNYVNKVLTYEKYEFIDGGNYLNNVLLVGGWDSNWTSRVAKPTINYGANNYFNTSNTTYGGFGGGTIHAVVSTSSSQGYSGTNHGVYNGINDGACIVNYTAHGDKQEWQVPQFTAAQVATLTNTGKYFFGIGNCCLTGNFNNTTTTYSPGSAIGANACFAETMIRVPNAGAVVYLGCSPYSYWYEDFYWAVGAHSYSAGNAPSVSNSSDGVYDVMFMDDSWNSASALLYVGNLAVQQAVTNGNTNSSITDGNCNNSAHYYFQFYHTFGDGSVMPYITKPEVNTVTIPSTVTPGTTSITVNALAGSYVAVTDNSSVIYGVAEANSSGVATVNFTNAIPGTGTLYVVVTRQQYQPYFGTISIVGGTQYNITATANPSNAGTVTGGGLLYENTTCTLTAVPNSGWDFVNWSDGNTDNPRSFTVTGPASFVANFAPLTLRNITLASVTNGTISADHTTAYKNDVVNLTATPASGYNLNNWVVFKTGDINTTVDVNGNSFTMPDYDVTISAIFSAPQGGDVTIGSGTSTTNGNYVPTSVYYNYSLTQQIYTQAELGEAGNITAISFNYGSSTASGSRTMNIYMSHTTSSTITSWSTVSSSQLVYSGSVDFTQGWNTLTLTTPFAYNGTSNILITVDDNTGSYNGNYSFYTYSTGANRAIYYRSDTSDPTPTGTVSVTANSIQYNAQMRITKEVPSTDGYISVSPTSLSGFSSVGGVSPSESQSVAIVGNNLQANLIVTAPTGFEVCTTPNGTYASALTLTPTNGELRTMVYVRLSANANPGSITGNMTFTCGSTTATVSLSGNVIPSGATQYTITANASPASGGTVSGAGTYYEGLTCTLTATANTGYVLAEWQLDGNTVSTDAQYSFTVAGDANYIAVFTEVPTYNITCNTVEHITISTDKAFAYAGETVTLTVTPDNGYSVYGAYVYKTTDFNTFVEVTDNSFTMPEYDVTVTATLAATSYDYAKVTSTQEDWSGEYLIVYEGGSLAFDGGLTTLDAANNYINVTISNNTIAATDVTNAAKFTIAPVDGGYSIKSSSGYYIGRTSNKNGMNTSTSQAYSNTISFSDDGVSIHGKYCYLRYNSSTNNGNRFRYYTSSTSQNPVQLYKKTSVLDTPTYTIHFEANGGMGDMEDQVVNEFVYTTLDANAFAKEGYSFIGWNTQADGSGVAFTDGESVRIIADMTLYAQWIPGELQVSYHLVTSADQLVAGETYLIVSTAYGKALSKTQNTNNRAAADVNITDDVISTLGDACELELGLDNGNWTFYDANLNGYLYAAGGSSNNYLRTQATINTNGQWSISISTEGVATITAQGIGSNNWLRYNNSNNLFSCYSSTSTQKDICLFRRVENIVMQQTLDLSTGWNWWSPIATMNLNDLETALDGKGVIINSQNGGFARYENGNWSGTLTSIAAGQMYKVKTTEAVSFTLTGTLVTPVEIDILPGYNWVGYTGTTATPIANALGSFMPNNGDRITAQDGSTITYNNGWSGSLFLVPGQGYLYYSTATQSRTLSF